MSPRNTKYQRMCSRMDTRFFNVGKYLEGRNIFAGLKKGLSSIFSGIYHKEREMIVFKSLKKTLNFVDKNL